jgi:hypothetical protein
MQMTKILSETQTVIWISDGLSLLLHSRKWPNRILATETLHTKSLEDPTASQNVECQAVMECQWHSECAKRAQCRAKPYFDSSGHF